MGSTTQWHPLDQERVRENSDDRVPTSFGHSENRDPPANIKDFDAWERAAGKVYAKYGLSYDDWQPKQFAMAMAIYRNIVKKPR